MGSILLTEKNPWLATCVLPCHSTLPSKYTYTTPQQTGRLNTDRCHLKRFAHESSRLLLRVAAVGVEGLRHRQDYVVHRQLFRLRIRLFRIGRGHARRRCRRLFSASLPGPLGDPPIPHSCHRVFISQRGRWP
jgi:hypothetical protein